MPLVDDSNDLFAWNELPVAIPEIKNADSSVTMIFSGSAVVDSFNTSGFGKDLVNWIGPDGTSMPTVPRYACEGLSTKDTWSTASNSNPNEMIEACFDDGIKYPVGMY